MRPLARTPTLREKIQVYEDLLHEMQTHMFTGSSEGMFDLQRRVSEWSYSHHTGNGNLSQRGQSSLINEAFWKLKRPTK